MQDVSRVTGSPVIIKAKGKEYALSGMTFGDLGIIQAEALRAKRARKIEVAAEVAKYFPPADFKAHMKEAGEEAEKIGLLSDQDFDDYTQSVNGAATFFWVLFERQYPREFTREDVLGIVAGGQIGSVEVLSLVAELTGAASAKNLTGPLASVNSTAG